MDDKFIYYLVIGAIYLISRVLKKKNPDTPIPQRPTTHSQEPHEEEQSKRPVSFEDLLKELTKEYTPEEKPVSKEFIYEEPVEEIIKPAPVEEISREELYVKKRHKEMEESLQLKRKQTLALEEAEKNSHEVLQLLKQEGGAANAIILSEILNRKYTV